MTLSSRGVSVERTLSISSLREMLTSSLKGDGDFGSAMKSPSFDSSSPMGSYEMGSLETFMIFRTFPGKARLQGDLVEIRFPAEFLEEGDRSFVILFMVSDMNGDPDGAGIAMARVMAAGSTTSSRWRTCIPLIVVFGRLHEAHVPFPNEVQERKTVEYFFAILMMSLCFACIRRFLTVLRPFSISPISRSLFFTFRASFSSMNLSCLWTLRMISSRTFLLRLRFMRFSSTFFSRALSFFSLSFFVASLTLTELLLISSFFSCWFLILLIRETVFFLYLSSSS